MPDETFKEFIVDQLAEIRGLRVKAMFGGYGLYDGEYFFGILMAGRLYFKTDERTREAYLKREMSRFVYEKARQSATMHYYEVPPEILENREEAGAWARRAIEVAVASSREKEQPGAKKSARSTNRNAARQ